MNKNFIISLSILIGSICLIVVSPNKSAAVERLQKVAILQQQALRIDVVQNQLVIGAQNFVSSTTERALSFLSDPNLSKKQREQKFREILQSSFDMKTIGRFSLGRYWRVSTEQQRTEYLDLFEKMVINVYSKRFGDYKGEKFDVQDARSEGKSDAIVTSYITPINGPKIQVDWRIRYKNGQYKVIDVIVEGVSMALTQRSDFASVIQRGGGQVDILLNHLRH